MTEEKDNTDSTSTIPKLDVKIEKIIEKIDDSVKQLGILLRVHDPQKLLNVLIIKQQLNIIKPAEVLSLNSNETIQTIDDILKPPPIVNRKKPKNHNMKITYGVMSAKEVVDKMKTRKDEDESAEQEKEREEILKLERLKKIRETEEKLRQDREELKILRANNTEKNKSIAVIRKLKAQTNKGRGNELTVIPDLAAEPVKKRRRGIKIER